MERKLNRELNFLLSTSALPITIQYFGNVRNEFDEFKKGKLDNAKQISEANFYPKHFKESHRKFVRIFELANLLGLSDDELLKKWRQSMKERKEQIEDYRLKPTPEGRDNKGVYVGSGGHNKNMVRYPSKKRSKRVWKIFYQMFPRLAERDGWDGQTSKKMK